MLMGKTEGNHNINNGLAKEQLSDKPSWAPTRTCGTNWSSERSGCWVTMVMFLPLPDKVWVHGCAMCWELRALSTVDTALSPLLLVPALLWRCSMGSKLPDSNTAMLVPCLGKTASWCGGLRAHRALELHYPEGKQVSVILNGMCFCQNRLAISLDK